MPKPYTALPENQVTRGRHLWRAGTPVHQAAVAAGKGAPAAQRARRQADDRASRCEPGTGIDRLVDQVQHQGTGLGRAHASSSSPRPERELRRAALWC